MAECKSCNAEMRWVINELSLRPMPMNQAPDPKGGFYLYFRNGEWYARHATADDKRLGRELYTSHFATCPHATKWRNNS